MGSCLSLYGETHATHYRDRNYSVGVCSMRGCRTTMEDSYCVHLTIPNHPTYSLFAVFDGFNGNAASQYFSNNLLNVINKLKHLEDDQLIVAAINKMDKHFLKLKDKNINNGSTIVFSLIKSLGGGTPHCDSTSIAYPSITSPITDILPHKEPSHLSLNSFSSHNNSLDKQKYEVSIFWVGDSRSILIKNEKKYSYDELTIDHHCSLDKERKRLIKYGKNIIINGKLDGITKLSRSFGCYSMKYQQKHICIAGSTHRICVSNDALLLHSDGLTEKWNIKELVAKYIHHYNQCKHDKNTMQHALNYLCEECIDTGSTDNITVIGIKFN